MIAFSLPSLITNERFLAKQACLPFTYTSLHSTRRQAAVRHFDNDYLHTIIGHGAADFALAQEAIRCWRMFPDGWTRLLPAAAPIITDTTVAMYARMLGVWWRNSCRIVYTIQEPARFGFAYGTLPGHIECGEELFWVGMESDGAVWYEVRAFSRPRHWLAWLGYPLVRYLQAKFRRDSAAQMQMFVLHSRTASEQINKDKSDK